MAEILKRGRNWYYRFTDGNGRRVMRKGCSDRRETEAMAKMAEAEAAKIRSGLIDPKALAAAIHETRPLSTHLDDWHAYLVGKGSTEQHANLSRNRVRRLIGLGRARKISDMAPSRIQAALKAVRDGDKDHPGVSLRSLHHYTRAVKGFSRWLWRDGRSREDALAHMTSPNPDADRRHVRRSLAAQELARLIQAAECGPVVLKTTGPDRAALYLVAAGTGFRANELRSLIPESFNLDGEPPTITVAAAYSKRRRDDVQPIRPELAETIRLWLAGKPAGRPVFGNLTKHTNILIQSDLARAGIPYRDASDRVADFHALRHSYVTALAMSNAPVKVVQSLARHSTPTLTLGIYAHVGLFDQTAALDALPDLGGSPPNREAAALPATGTDGATDKPGFAPPLRPTRDGQSRSLPDRVAMEAATPTESTPVPLACKALPETGLDTCGRDQSATVGSGGGGIRTHGRLAPSTVFKTVEDPAESHKDQGSRTRKRSLALSLRPAPSELPADLAEIVQAWPTLPEPVRDQILKVIREAVPPPVEPPTPPPDGP